MIVLLHQDEMVLETRHISGNEILILDQYTSQQMNMAFFQIAQDFPNEKIVWCHSRAEEYVSFRSIEKKKQLDIEMFSYHPSQEHVFHRALNYSQFFSPIINNIPSDVCYQTWIMSEAIGFVSAKLIQKFKVLKGCFSFQFTLNAISKMGSSEGLLHYSEPALYDGPKIEMKQETYIDTLYFIRLFQNKKWLIYAYLLNLYKFKSHSTALVKVLLKKKYHFKIPNFDELHPSLSTIDKSDSVDVLIPTLGRKKYLYDVLEDLSKQTHLPVCVIVVEQNADTQSESDLGYITNQKWPFEIKHTFIHQLGACNARNLGLSQAKARWLFMADDDIRFEPDTLKNNIELAKSLNVDSVSIATYLPHQVDKKRATYPYLYEGFASGASVVHRKYYSQLNYDMSFEFGYGEDTAYGCELRKLGCATVYSPINAILHLKAPIGGFRFAFKHPWIDDEIQPKPSPTMMYLHENYYSKEQLFGYKVYLFMRLIVKRHKINVFKFLREFKQQWKSSQHYSSLYRKKSK